MRNPNGDFNGAQGLKGVSPGEFLFDYSPYAAVDLAAYGVYFTGSEGTVPRLVNEDVPVLYPPILNVTAGAGGVTLEGNVTLFPSPDQNLTITTTDGGNLSATPNLSIPIELYMSDSAHNQWTHGGVFSDSDHGSTLTELDNPNPVLINISGSMENLILITSRETQINVGGDMINCGFSGQNLHAGDVTSITVTGQIYNQSAYTFVDGISLPGVANADLPAGVGNAWDVIFLLALDPTAIANYTVPAGTPESQWAADALKGASLFGYSLKNGQVVSDGDQGFFYNAATGTLGYGGAMPQSLLSALTQPITILRLVNGVPVLDANGHFETQTVNWAPASAIQTLFTASQIDPSPTAGQLGYRIGGPGQFDVTASSISLGNTYGILSCGVDDPEGGSGRYNNLVSLTPSGATLNVTVTADQTGTEVVDGTTILPHNSLDMLTSTIAALGGGDVNLTSTDGSMDLGSQALFNTSRQVGFGVFTSDGGNVNVVAQGDINIDGSRVATYNGGNIFVESLAGNVDVGSGGDTSTGVGVSFIDNETAAFYTEHVYGSGIVANTLVPPTKGQLFPANAAKAPGNITVETPQGNITASLGGITQESVGTATPVGPTITLEAGTPGGHVGNIDGGKSGVIGGTVIATANGNIDLLIISRQNSTVQAVGNFSGSVLGGGVVSVSGALVTGVIVGVGGVSVSGSVTAEVLGQNVSVNGGSATSTLGTSAAATTTSGSAAQQATDQTKQEVASNTGDDDQKKKKVRASVRVKRVTVILPQKS